MFWIVLASILTHVIYCKIKKTSWTLKKLYRKDSEYEMEYPFIQNVLIEDEYYPLAIFKEKTYLVSNQKSKFNIRTVSPSKF